MKKEELSETVKNFGKVKALVIGDLMLDEFIYGSVNRISPEAPIPILKVEKEEYFLGGSLNTSNNITTLGAECFHVGLLGIDIEAKKIRKLAKKNKIELKTVKTKKRTIRKVRVAERQQFIRFDYENEEEITAKENKELMKKVKELAKKVDVIIFSDYGKGTIKKKLFSETMKAKGKIPMVVDPQPVKNYFYKNSTLITPNEKEAKLLAFNLGLKYKNTSDLAKKISNRLNTPTLITLGAKGMLFNGKGKSFRIKGRPVEVFDVMGAGDTVVAVNALSLALKKDFKLAANLSNIAASIVVQKKGTFPITKKLLLKEIEG